VRIPVAASGGVLLLGEHVTMRLLGAGTALLCGVLLALTARWRKSLETTKEQR
jgi:drug/metabolite transporter (DMT)-like permease